MQSVGRSTFLLHGNFGGGQSPPSTAALLLLDFLTGSWIFRTVGSVSKWLHPSNSQGLRKNILVSFEKLICTRICKVRVCLHLLNVRVI